MTTVSKSALVPYSASQMFELVADAESYPDFLPGCRSSRIESREGDIVRGTVEFAKGPVHKSFTTDNRLEKDRRIDMPALIIWGGRGQSPERAQRFADVWSQYAANVVHAEGLDCGHYMQEEVPEEVLSHFMDFFAG